MRKDEFPGGGQVVVCPGAISWGARFQGGGGLVFVAEGPAGPADAVLVEEVQPGLALLGEHAAAAVGPAGAPLADEMQYFYAHDKKICSIFEAEGDRSVPNAETSGQKKRKKPRCLSKNSAYFLTGK